MRPGTMECKVEYTKHKKIWCYLQRLRPIYDTQNQTSIDLMNHYVIMITPFSTLSLFSVPIKTSTHTHTHPTPMYFNSIHWIWLDLCENLSEILSVRYGNRNPFFSLHLNNNNNNNESSNSMRATHFNLVAALFISLLYIVPIVLYTWIF